MHMLDDASTVCAIFAMISLLFAFVGVLAERGGWQ